MPCLPRTGGRRVRMHYWCLDLFVFFFYKICEIKRLIPRHIYCNRRPLFHPCICSGSIGLTHQDCLQSWLKVQRGDGSCELCKTKFRFAPKYAPNAPAKLSPYVVLSGMLRRLIARWLPFTIRSVFAASLWLLVAPLITAYLYHGWMARPSAVLQRVTSWKSIVTDLISGGVVASCIVISFLSLMSFADFLRLELQQRQRGGGVGGVAQNINRLPNREMAARVAAGEDIDEHDDDDMNVDDGIWDEMQMQRIHRKAHENALNTRLRPRVDRAGDNGEADRINNHSNNGSFTMQGANPLDHEDEDDEDVDDEDYEENDDSDDVDSWDSTIYDDLDDADEADANINDLDPLYFHPEAVEEELPIPPRRRERVNVEVPQRRRPRQGQANDGFALLDQEDPIDMDINIALDELLGIRGPLLVVARNLLWLLAFNAVYLGFFAFVPRTIGIAMSSIVFNTTAVLSASAMKVGDNSTDSVSLLSSSSNISLVDIWKSVEAESIRHDTTFRLNDISAIAVGYISIAVAVIAFRYLWTLSLKIRSFRSGNNHREIAEAYNLPGAFDEMNRLVQGLGNDDPPQGDQDVAIGLALGVAIDVTVAIVKVGVLLFLKMFLLPIFLGIALDASTISLFGSTLEDRILFAGKDIFSFILLHWVAGITFMLLVTVSVLQLREVAHPDLLSQMIRPQEPQPDLLGNLMNESVSTHSKRMVLSLIIYAFLLTMHIYLPVRFGVAKLMGGEMKEYLHLKFCYVLPPQLQVPLELLFFHLCMLALLEKYKNGLGGMQHQWLTFMTRVMGLSECMVPHTVGCFRHIGSRPIFVNGRLIDPVWYKLADNDKDTLASIESMFTFHDTNIRFKGESKNNGERVVVCGVDFIRLPSPPPKSGTILLPTKLGRYRLKRDEYKKAINLWEEVPGAPILRPPEGWDDLGVGGADVQGRWAWGSEKKSKIENSVAVRRPFFGSNQSVAHALSVLLKLLGLAGSSWLAVSTVLFVVAATPLFVGRSLYCVFRVPTSWVHDPLAFGLGFTIVFPLLKRVANLFVANDRPIYARLRAWISRLHAPPLHKAYVLMATSVCWFGVAPLLLGACYDIAFIKSLDWFDGKQPFHDTHASFWSWMEGTVLLYIWAELCIFGAFTRNYRVFAPDGPVQHADEEHDANSSDQRSSWQGKNGRVARFWGVWKSVLQGWEWDQVDEVVLLRECSIPIVTELLYALLLPILVYGICLFQFPFLSGFTRSVIARSGLALTCCVRVSRAWKDQLRNFFRVLHKTARDDLYLIGEVLINHGD